MNKNAIGLHKFSRFFSGDDAVRFLCTPRADCNDAAAVAEGKDKPFASTRSVQIATVAALSDSLFGFFASTRPVQIATAEMHRIAICTFQNVC